MSVQYLSRPGKPRLAYVHTKGEGPLVVFLGGFQSDMNGTKATWLEERVKARGQAFLRLDYSGHGQSEGAFRDGTIGAWKEDALAVIRHVTKGPLVLIGSSMGGWIGLSILAEGALEVKGFVGIAAAPDFTQGIYDRMTPDQRQRFERDGFIEEPNDYGPQPYVFTRNLFEDGKNITVLNKTHERAVPMHLIQGKRDADVDWRTPEKIKAAFPQADVKITLIEDGDHRLSRPEDLTLIDEAARELSR